jgi:hypothetical protein
MNPRGAVLVKRKPDTRTFDTGGLVESTELASTNHGARTAEGRLSAMQQSLLNQRKLLLKYISHIKKVTGKTGIDPLDRHIMSVDFFTDEEWEELQTLEKIEGVLTKSEIVDL